MTDFEMEFSLEPSTELPKPSLDTSVPSAVLQPSTSLSFDDVSSAYRTDVPTAEKQTILQEIAERTVVVPEHLRARVTELEQQGVKTKTALDIAEYEHELKQSISAEKLASAVEPVAVEPVPLSLWFSLVFAVCSLIDYSTLFLTLSLVCRYIFVDGHKLKSGFSTVLKQLIFALIIGVIMLRGFDLLSMHGYLPDWLWFYKV